MSSLASPDSLAVVPRPPEWMRRCCWPSELQIPPPSGFDDPFGVTVGQGRFWAATSGALAVFLRAGAVTPTPDLGAAWALPLLLARYPDEQPAFLDVARRLCLEPWGNGPHRATWERRLYDVRLLAFALPHLAGDARWAISDRRLVLTGKGWRIYLCELDGSPIGRWPSLGFDEE